MRFEGIASGVVWREPLSEEERAQLNELVESAAHRMTLTDMHELARLSRELLKAYDGLLLRLSDETRYHHEP